MVRHISYEYIGLVRTVDSSHTLEQAAALSPEMFDVRSISNENSHSPNKNL